MDFPIHDLETAPGASRDALAQVAERYGFIPNLAGAFASSPGALDGLLGVLGAYDAPTLKLGPVERQVVLLTVSVANRCAYCAAAHGMVATISGLDRTEVERLQHGRPLTDPRLQALARFTRTVLATQGHPTDEDLQRFADAGFGAAEVLEVVFGVAVKTLTNYANHIARPAVNAQFADFLPRWAEQAA